MKHYFKFILLYLVFAPFLLPAQDSLPPSSPPNSRIIKYKKLQLGIVGDINTVKLVTHSSSVDQSYGNEFGGGGGIHFQYNLKRQLALTLNCLYEQKNWKSVPFSFHGRNINENRLHIITLPLMVKHSPFKRNFFMVAGPYLGIVLKKEVKGFEVGNTVYKSPFEAVAALGLGFNIPVSNAISILIEDLSRLEKNTLVSGTRL